MSSLSFRYLSLSLCLVLIGCSADEGASTRPSRPLPDYSYREPESPSKAELLPWEVWSPFRDLAGTPLANQQLLLGDELLTRGQRRSALDAYLLADLKALPANEVEAATVRISSQYLALDQAQKALSTVTGYFHQKNLQAKDASEPFCLLLAFGYGRLGNADQALAWFSQAYQQSKGRGPVADLAQKGMSLFLRTVPETPFENISIRWRSDSIVNQAIGRERLRRSTPAYDPDDYNPKVPFWSAFYDESLKGQPLQSGQDNAGRPVVGVILSLSSKFGALGRDTRQGFELAIAADPQQPPLAIEVRDVGADSAGASAAVRELVTGAGASVVVGPLLTEAAVAAATTARELAVPLVSFSKSESFQTGGGIFRLGATTSSQVDALMNAAYGEYQLSRFALIYPRTAVGTEYADEFRRKVGAFGLSLVYEGSYAPGDEVGLAQAAQEVEMSNAEALIIPDGIEVSSRLLANLSPAARKQIRPLGTALWDNPVKIANSQTLFERAVFVTPFFPQSTRPVVQEFTMSYRGKYQSPPNFLAAQGFDVGTIVRTALRQSIRDGVPFAEALSRMPPYNGVTGAMSFEPGGGIKRNFYVVEVTKDSFLEKAVGGEPAGRRESFTFRGDQQLESDTRGASRGLGERVPSGY